MAAVLGLGNGVIEPVMNRISAFLGRSWSVVGSCNTDANDVANIADVLNCPEWDPINRYDEEELYDDSLEPDCLWRLD